MNRKGIVRESKENLNVDVNLDVNIQRLPSVRSLMTETFQRFTGNALSFTDIMRGENEL